MDSWLCTAADDFSARFLGKVQLMSQTGGLNQESEHDLAVMVSDFLENGSGDDDSWYSSDSDSGFSDISNLADKISLHRHSVDRYQSDLLSVVHCIVLSMKETDIHPVKSASCNASCVRFSLAKLLRTSGYDAAVCAAQWQRSGKILGGNHEYIDVVNHKGAGCPERLIIDIDFQSHFEIARAVDSYNRILNSLPVVYVGSLVRLKQFLKVMVDAVKYSLKQNSMPLPPWRSLPYLQSKWESPYQRLLGLDETNTERGLPPEGHAQCGGHLRRLQHSLNSEIKAKRLLKPINSDNNLKLKLRRRRQPSFRNL